MGWHSFEGWCLGWDQNFPGYFPCPSGWLLSSLLPFQTLLAFALLLQTPELAVWGECVCLWVLGEGCWGSGGEPELGGGRGFGVSEGSRRMVGHHRSLREDPAHFAGHALRRAFDCQGAHSGNRHPFVDLQGSPGIRPALQRNIWEALAPPRGEASEPWRQRSMTSSWLLLNPCPRQVFFWEPVRSAGLWCQGSCAVAVKTFTFAKRVGAEEGAGEGEQWEVDFSGTQSPSGVPCLPLTGSLAGETASWAIAGC